MTLPPDAGDVIHLGGRGSCKPCQAGDHDRCDTAGDWPAPCRCWAFDNHGARPTRSVEEEDADREEEAHYRHTRIGGADL